MTTIQNTTATTNTSSSALSAASQNMLDQEDFLTMMLAQMKNQDPTKPMEGQEQLAQLAQFSTLSSIQELQKSFETLAQSLMSIQTGQATNLVGKQVLVDSDTGYYAPGQALEGQVNVPNSVSNVTLKIYGANGQLVDTVNMGSQSAGQVPFSLNSAAMSAGTYKVVATGTVNGEAQQFATQIWNRVESVAVGKNGQSSSLQHAGAGNVDMGAVRAIR